MSTQNPYAKTWRLLHQGEDCVYCQANRLAHRRHYRRRWLTARGRVVLLTLGAGLVFGVLAWCVG
jgi:hypothetical protein